MKKIISVFLCLILMLSLAVPAFAAGEVEEYPTIYVTGAQTNNLYSADGELIYPTSVDLMEQVKKALIPCVQELALGFLRDDYSDYADTLYEYLSPIYEKVVLDKNGEASDGSRPEYHSATVAVSNKQSNYGMWDYRFWYDWRLSPIVTAEELKAYIDRVTEATGKDKVQLVGRCYGANVIQTYITLYKEHAIENVSDVAYYASSIEGIDFMSALFSGEVVLEAQAIANFLNSYADYNNLIENEDISVFVFALVELFNQCKVLGLGTDAVQLLFDTIKDDLLPKLLPAVIGTWPSYWSMVTPELYTKSVDYILGENKEEYAEFIKKTDKYHYEVQLTARDTILELQNKGINFYIFTKYGFADMPLYEGATIAGDSYTSVPRQSFGAEAASFGEVFPEAYLSSLEDKTYLSPDLKINAATALLPERSWFIRNLHHNEFAALHDMTLEMMRYDFTVENEKYPQFMNYEGGLDFSAIEGTDEDYNKPKTGPLAALMKFLSAFVNLIVRLFKGEISLDFGSLLG